MGQKKLGRPTDNPKDISLKIRLDKETSKKLDDCIETFHVSKAEIVRRGIHKMHEDIPE